MASSFEKSVKGATKIKAAPPKTKYIEHILVATHAGEAGVGEVFRALQYRLRDSTWTVVFKSLITIHLMIREGSPDATLAYLAKHRNMLAISSFADAQIQGKNIRHYAAYLAERTRAYKDTKIDWVRAKETRLEKLSIDKGLLRETEVVQNQLTALLKCDVLDEPENEITITVFRLLVLDLLALFQVLNQAMINILGQFFEMSKPDAERAMGIYRNFTKQTDFVVQYLSIARQWEHHTRVEVPKLKHAPVNLGRQLEEYLNDADFEIHRRQYIAEQSAKRAGGASSKSGGTSSTPNAAAAKLFGSGGTNGTSAAPASSSKPSAPAKGPEPDLIDFFESIEQNQTPMALQSSPEQQQQFQQMHAMPTGNPYGGFQVPQQGQMPPNGFAPQQTGFQANNPFPAQPTGQFQQQGTGAGVYQGFQSQPGFAAGALSSIPQDSVASFQQTPGMLAPMQTGLQPGQQITNPFRASMLMANPTGMQGPVQTQQMPLQRQNTNPFARSSPQNAMPFNNPPPANSSPFQSQVPTGTPPPAAPLQPTKTGTNPFAKNFGGAGAAAGQQQRPQTSAGLVPQPTGSTNPFRQGAFVNHQTGLGWQHNQQPIGGGLDQLETVPVFPRPQQQTPWQQ
ncbi:ENTH domain-containing protein [Microdochium trichocladiopsis]|uniref:ENTH domain-containing protein n=1 Tax=Microdochium trichocladiopsis TaxID=1682393 RepID=A0A9P8Y840_9PEZI|nr:ENTH domain-containing protein [Microdochium trichocladiopsis]KAH7034684.1 ENTH domain-containing protein [Microdochium trichocladiopsis]